MPKLSTVLHSIAASVLSIIIFIQLQKMNPTPAVECAPTHQRSN